MSDPLVANQLLSLSTTSPELFFSRVTIVLLIAGGCIIGLLIICMVWSRIGRSRTRAKGALPAPELATLREELVDAVGVASQTQGAHVSLRGFWKDRGLTSAQKFVVLDDLLQRQVFYRAYSNDKVISFFQSLRWDWLNRPVSYVRLSDQHWTKLATGTSPGIVAGKGAIVVQDSPGAGVMSRSPHSTQNTSVEFSPQLVYDVAEALRNDSKALVPDHPLALTAEDFARQLELYAKRSEWENAKATLAEVMTFAANSAGLWASTLAILASG